MGAKSAAGLATALIVVNRVGRGGREEVLLKREKGTDLIEIPEIEEKESPKRAKREKKRKEEKEEISSSGPVRRGSGERGGQVTAPASPFFSPSSPPLKKVFNLPSPREPPAPAAPAAPPLGAL